jgi:hypothetical protein
MKSHDYHVFMERLLPIALREFLPPNVWNALTELSLFYKDLCSPKLSIYHLKKLESEILVLICNFEKIFPLGFFDVMEHLILHFPYEARVCGLAQYNGCILLIGRNSLTITHSYLKRDKNYIIH